MMKYIEVSNQGQNLIYRSGPKPLPKDNEVLIRVFATGVNRADLVQRKGGYAEYCVAHEGSCLPVPDGFDFIHAAAVPEAAFTAWTMIWELGQLAERESLLIHGGSSGIGTFAVQMAAALGHTVYTTAGSAEKCHACLQLGVHAAINYKTQNFVEEINSLTNGKGVDVVLDMVGGDYVQRNLNAMVVEGRMILIAFLGGRVAHFDIAKLMRKRQQILAATLRSRSVEYKKYLAQKLQKHIWPHLASGNIKPVIDRIYPLAQAEKAHKRIQSGEGIGKIILINHA